MNKKKYLFLCKSKKHANATIDITSDSYQQIIYNNLPQIAGLFAIDTSLRPTVQNNSTTFHITGGINQRFSQISYQLKHLLWRLEMSVASADC